MKAQNTLRKLKTAIFVSVLFLAIGSLNSCEKSEDIQPAPSSNVDPLIKTEIIVVEKDQWLFNRTNQQATLGCTILPNRSGYEYVKVFIRVKKDETQVDIWQELPNGTTEFQVTDDKVCILKPTNWTPERTVFRVEIKLIESPIVRYDVADLSPIENTSK